MWINPFYWNGPDDNSLAGNSSAKGHIELEADLPETGFKDNSGVYDRDPKVSGEIVVRGGASDDKMLKSLTVEFAEFTATAEFDGTSWMLPSAGNNEWTLSVTDEGVTQTGHQVTWEFTVDTSRISGVAGADKAVTVSVTDAGPKTGGGSNSSDSSTTQTTAGNPTPYYRLDVVPYITGVKTALNSLKSNNASVFSRTALGRYPVNEGETVTLTGFNLGGSGGVTAVTGVTSGITVQSDGTVTVPVKDLSSGQLELTVSGIPALNNRNNNDARGSYEYTGTVEFNTSAASLAGFYNRQPNGDNNNLLTDDVSLDVWQFNSEAAKPVRGVITDPVMKINPDNGMIGFAFANGPDYFSMANGNNNSYVTWERNYDDFAGTSFIYDSRGNTYGTTVGRYINSNTNHGGRFNFVISLWGRGETKSQGGNYNPGNHMRLESIGVPKDAFVNGILTEDAILDKSRIRSPSLAVAEHGTDGTSVYLAYYDDINQQIRFRYGEKIPDSVAEFDQFVDQKGVSNQLVADNAVFESSTMNYSVVAGNRYTVGDSASVTGKPDGFAPTGNTAGEYLSLGVIPGASAAEDVAVLTWYDGSDLWFTYKKAPCNDNDAGTGAGDGYWSAAVKILSGAGEYCKLAVDADGGIHIAAYDGMNGDLVYAYLENCSDSSAATCIVDSYGIVGQYLSIDVAKDTSGKWIPYIGYYALSSTRPKLAYLAEPDAAGNGATDDMYTGVWEISLVPTSGKAQQDTVGVGVWKNSSGVIKESETGTSVITDAYSGTCYGNGTINPVLGYVVKSGTSGSIETAQKK